MKSEPKHIGSATQVNAATQTERNKAKISRKNEIDARRRPALLLISLCIIADNVAYLFVTNESDALLSLSCSSLIRRIRLDSLCENLMCAWLFFFLIICIAIIIYLISQNDGRK